MWGWGETLHLPSGGDIFSKFFSVPSPELELWSVALADCSVRPSALQGPDGAGGPAWIPSGNGISTGALKRWTLSFFSAISGYELEVTLGGQ